VFPDGTCFYGSYCTIQGAEYKYGSTTYSDVSLGYNIEPLNTRVEFGVNNLFDKQPPLLYANNTLNANTDPSDFDTIGRYFWAGLRSSSKLRLLPGLAWRFNRDGPRKIIARLCFFMARRQCDSKRFRRRQRLRIEALQESSSSECSLSTYERGEAVVETSF
jgi:hypothetical protein